MKALAERYASALVDVALEKKQADQVKQELAAFAAMIRESAELHAFLSNPSIARASKHAAIEQLVARMGASRTLRNYLFVIVDQRRAGMLPEIEQAFSALLDARQGITQASVTSAADLTAEERAELDAALAKLTGKKVQAQFSTDPALIGGAVVKIGSTIYDGSVRAQLLLRRAFRGDQLAARGLLDFFDLRTPRSEQAFRFGRGIPPRSFPHFADFPIEARNLRLYFTQLTLRLRFRRGSFRNASRDCFRVGAEKRAAVLCNQVGNAAKNDGEVEPAKQSFRCESAGIFRRPFGSQSGNRSEGKRKKRNCGERQRPPPDFQRCCRRGSHRAFPR